MRLSKKNRAEIRRLSQQIFGIDARVYLFGSRLNDKGLGGDVDLFVQSSSPIPAPAYQSAQLATRASRLLAGRKVDVIIGAPNLAAMPIHRIAKEEGVPL